ncbi:MAG TPA: 16S rRNA (uracil(1498)-N(3))-methyltransferase [Myxococcales bacterium]|nr:16S rRNA (uracil(1498)-N(3))-methyltransferase [Myxococcales bacterium]
MNLVLLLEEDWIEADCRVRLHGRRRRHVLEIHRARLGDELRVGRLDGAVGHGRITRVDEDAVEMEVRLDADPPPPLGITVVLALPRPPVLRRTLISLTSMGVKRIALLNADGVEKSFWQSRALDAEAVFEQCVLGLEQARDTRMPEVVLRKRFKPFAEDELEDWIAGGRAFVAEPARQPTPASALETPTLLAVGPESGWSSYELASLQRAGLERISLGIRPLRVETALPALLARLA